MFTNIANRHSRDSIWYRNKSWNFSKRKSSFVLLIRFTKKTSGILLTPLIRIDTPSLISCPIHIVQLCFRWTTTMKMWEYCVSKNRRSRRSTCQFDCTCNCCHVITSNRRSMWLNKLLNHFNVWNMSDVVFRLPMHRYRHDDRYKSVQRHLFDRHLIFIKQPKNEISFFYLQTRVINIQINLRELIC